MAAAVEQMAPARGRHLLAASGHAGNAAETVAARNPTRRGTYVFLDVYLPEHGSASAAYRTVINTSR